MENMELRFTASVAESYDQMMVPLVFQPYAEELAHMSAHIVTATK